MVNWLQGTGFPWLPAGALQQGVAVKGRVRIGDKPATVGLLQRHGSQVSQYPAGA